MLEAETGVKPARWRAPLRAAGLDPRLCLQPRLSMRSTPRCGSTANRYRRIEWFARFQNTEAQHQQLTHRSHDNLLGFEAAPGLQPRHQSDDRGVISHRPHQTLDRSFDELRIIWRSDIVLMHHLVD